MTGPAPLPRPAPRIVGLCTGRTDVDWFARDKAGIAAAQAVCATCPSTLPCYAAAVANNELFGVWAGVDFSLPRYTRGHPRRPVPICGTSSGYKSHRGRGEQACDDCKAAHVAYNAYTKQQRQRNRN